MWHLCLSSSGLSTLSLTPWQLTLLHSVRRPASKRRASVHIDNEAYGIEGCHCSKFEEQRAKSRHQQAPREGLEQHQLSRKLVPVSQHTPVTFLCCPACTSAVSRGRALQRCRRADALSDFRTMRCASKYRKHNHKLSNNSSTKRADTAAAVLLLCRVRVEPALEIDRTPQPTR